MIVMWQNKIKSVASNNVVNGQGMFKKINLKQKVDDRITEHSFKYADAEAQPVES